MLKIKLHIFKTILELNALNPCDNFKLAWDNSNLTISSICRGCTDLPSRTYSLSFNNSTDSTAVEEFLHSMCTKGFERIEYFYLNAKSIPTKNICDRIFHDLFQLSTYIPVFEYKIKCEKNRLIISNAPLGITENDTKTITITYTNREAKDVQDFLTAMCQRNHDASKHWSLKIKYLPTCG